MPYGASATASPNCLKSAQAIVVARRLRLRTSCSRALVIVRFNPMGSRCQWRLCSASRALSRRSRISRCLSPLRRKGPVGLLGTCRVLGTCRFLGTSRVSRDLCFF
ncbi:unnamed protein product [Symbiodinium sp. KB8]|nr:unnamed protein product [Symbiodinium sp. KB8]